MEEGLYERTDKRAGCSSCMRTDENGRAAATLEGWGFAHHFDFVLQRDRNVRVKFKLCSGQKRVSTAAKATSNVLEMKSQRMSGVSLEPQTSHLNFKI